MQQTYFFLNNPSLLCRLKKSLYGLKQARRASHAKIDGFFLSLNYCRCNSDENVYLNMIHGYLIIILLYLDDLLITGSSKKEISSLKSAMNHAFSMTDLGSLSQFWGLEISQSDLIIKVHNSKHYSFLLKNFKMKDLNPRKHQRNFGV